MLRSLRRQPWTAEDEDNVLVQRCLGGHPEAFGAIYDRYFPLLYSYAWRMLGDQISAEDAAHDTLTRAWSKLRSYQPGNFRSWLFSIAHNTIIDQRRARRDAELPLAGERQWIAPDSTEQAALDAVMLGQAADLLSRFAPEQRSIVAMKLSGLRHSEIAAALGKSEAAVTQEYCRSIKRLADALERGVVPTAPGKGGGHDV
jgi:RNA polymerase sigma-70 factor (ECF subfamily)